MDDPTIGILLPLRLETRFVPPGDNPGWKLRVRVVPDAVSIDRHDPDPTAEELDDLEELARARHGDFASEAAKLEWARFAARRGAARAAWLVQKFPPVPGTDPIRIERPVNLSRGQRPARVVGLPPTLEIWLARGGAAATLAATLNVDSTQLTLDMPDPATLADRWWTSFKAATSVGLAAEIDLGAMADDIDVLYVVGIGGGDPASLFEAHRDRGALGVLALGTPTNSVDGDAAADLGTDPDFWRKLLLSQDTGLNLETAAAAGQVLMGESVAVTPLPGTGPHHLPLNQAMLAALWSAVFGHGLSDVLGVENTPAAGMWALDNLVPDGPFPAIRIEDQPYGLLPITALGAWKPDSGDPAVEAGMLPTLLELRDRWVKAAETRGTVVGADTQRLLEVIGQTPQSTSYAHRWWLPLPLVHALGFGLGAGVPWQTLLNWWKTAAALPLSSLALPTLPYVAYGNVHDLRIPLFQPDKFPQGKDLEEAIKVLVSKPAGTLSETGLTPDRGPLADLLGGKLPNSLFLRLLVLSFNRADAGAALETSGQKSMLSQPWSIASGTPTLIAQWAQMPLGTSEPGPASRIAKSARAGAFVLAGLAAVPKHIPTLERVMKSVLDTAAYRLDPWLTGVAWRRFRTLSSSRQLGAYGWVDGPRPRAVGVETIAPEFLHAPSQAQAMTAAILRDRALSDPEPERWHMDLHSDRVRLAKEMAVEVRLGAHISEVLGRAVERAVASRADIDRLRGLHPIRIEHEARRVCDGQAVLAQVAKDPADLGLSEAQLAALQPIAQAADAYADLLVADAVHDVVSGRGGMAAASMEAAAGLAAPPDLEVIKTQRHGASLSTCVLIALPVPQAPAPPEVSRALVVPSTPVSPGRIAEPAVAAFLDTAFGAATDPAWTWQVLNDMGAPIANVTLASLGLAPIDTISLSPEELAAAALERIRGGTAVTPAQGLEAHIRVRSMADLLGGQPARLQDLADREVADDDAGIRSDLLGRYAALRSAARSSQQRMQSALAGTEAQQRAALADARRWGIAPLGLEPAANLPTRVERAHASLAGRLQAALSEERVSELAVVELARAITELASPEGRIPVFAHHGLSTMPVTLTAEPVDPSTSRYDLDPDWIEVVAAVREPVARLEAFQLEQRGLRVPVGAAKPMVFRAWTNHPGDPWQVQKGAGDTAPSKLVAIFGPAGVLDPGTRPTRQIALAVLDSWVETVPAVEQATSVAFHVDAPTSRAPQAILIAVPPDVGSPLDGSTLVQIVADARALARVRAVTPSDLDEIASGLPLTVLPVMGTTGIWNLDPA